MQPLKPDTLHPIRRPPSSPDKEVEAGADAQSGASRGAFSLDASREQLLTRRADGKEHQPGGVVQDEADGLAHRARVALEARRRIVVGQRGETIAGTQRRQALRPQTDDGDGLAARQVGEQAGGEIAAGNDRRGRQAEAARRLGDDAGIEQPQDRRAIDPRQHRIAVQADEVIGIRRDDIPERRLVRTGFDPARRTFQGEVGKREAEQAYVARRPHSPSLSVSRPSERAKVPASPDAGLPVPRVSVRS